MPEYPTFGDNDVSLLKKIVTNTAEGGGGGAAAAGTLTGTTLASNVIASSLLSAAGGLFGSAAFTNAPVWSTISGTTPALVFSDTPKIVEWTPGGDSVPTFSGMDQGREITLFVIGPCTNTYPAWTWVEGVPPALASGKLMEINALCRGTTAASVRAVYAVQA